MSGRALASITARDPVSRAAPHGAAEALQRAAPKLSQHASPAARSRRVPCTPPRNLPARGRTGGVCPGRRRRAGPQVPRAAPGTAPQPRCSGRRAADPIWRGRAVLRAAADAGGAPIFSNPAPGRRCRGAGPLRGRDVFFVLRPVLSTARAPRPSARAPPPRRAGKGGSTAICRERRRCQGEAGGRVNAPLRARAGGDRHGGARCPPLFELVRGRMYVRARAAPEPTDP
eukprot:scaffold2734_cov350-Prasinococcus_capsulatus_cf.AAC.5